jgi:hypothetical protein
MRKSILAAACAAALMCAGQAGATTTIVEQTLVSGNPFAGSGYYPPTYSVPFGPTLSYFSFTGPARYLNIGDTLVWKLKLAPGDQITANGLHSVAADMGVLMEGIIDVVAHGSISLLDSAGNVVVPGPDRAVDDGAFALALNMLSSPLAALSFSEIDASFTLDGFSNSSLGLDPPGAYFVQPRFSMDADSRELPISMLAIPEPSTWALLLLGVFGLGAMLRRRRDASVRVPIGGDAPAGGRPLSGL